MFIHPISMVTNIFGFSFVQKIYIRPTLVSGLLYTLNFLFGTFFFIYIISLLFNFTNFMEEFDYHFFPPFKSLHNFVILICFQFFSDVFLYCNNVIKQNYGLRKIYKLFVKDTFLKIYYINYSTKTKTLPSTERLGY